MQRTVDFYLDKHPQEINKLPQDAEPVEIFVGKDQVQKYYIIEK